MLRLLILNLIGDSPTLRLPIRSVHSRAFRSQWPSVLRAIMFVWICRSVIAVFLCISLFLIGFRRKTQSIARSILIHSLLINLVCHEVEVSDS